MPLILVTPYRVKIKEILGLLSGLNAWGFNGGSSGGRAGLGSIEHSYDAVNLNPESWLDIAASNQFSLALKSDGSVWATGTNTYGQLGDLVPQNGVLSSFTKLNELKCKSIGSGIVTSYFVTEGGELYSLGNTSNGESGTGLDDNVYRSHLMRVGTDTDWSKVFSSHGQSAYALKNDSTLWAWGDNPHGQLGLGHTTDTAVPTKVGTVIWDSVDAGAWHAAGIDSAGNLYTWGRNGNGQLGTGATRSSNQLTPRKLSGTWKDVACGRAHTVAIRSDGRLLTAGANYSGQLGQGHTNDTTTNDQLRVVGSDTDWKSVHAGNDFTLAVKEDGSLWGCGRSNYGQLLLNGGDSYSFVKIADPANWQKIECGGVHVLALVAN